MWQDHTHYILRLEWGINMGVSLTYVPSAHLLQLWRNQIANCWIIQNIAIIIIAVYIIVKEIYGKYGYFHSHYIS